MTIVDPATLTTHIVPNLLVRIEVRSGSLTERTQYQILADSITPLVVVTYQN